MSDRKLISYYMEFINQEEVYTYVQRLMEQAEQFYNKNFKVPTISFDLYSSTSGRAWYNRNHIQFNPILMAQHYDEYWKDTIPHEISHIIAFMLYGKDGVGHGVLWKNVMFKCFGLVPERCHNYDTQEVRYKRKKYVYICNCEGKEYNLTKHLHDKHTSKHLQYSCKQCKQSIIFNGHIR